MKWREYHESTKHTRGSLRQARQPLDWANMPDPFRHYEGAPVLDLPTDPPAPDAPALEVLGGAFGETLAIDGSTFLSQILFYSASISASKRVPSTGYRYALRVNPSSGNLHPTEFHFITRDVFGWPDGLYHYRPSAHMVEQRATSKPEMQLGGSTAPIVFVLTSIAWREAWKYRDRAYRYCLHDIGHAWQSLALAARAMGCDSYATGDFSDDEVTRSIRLHEDEWPMLIIELRGRAIPRRQQDSSEAVWYGGHANQLSSEVVSYPQIDAIHSATKLHGRACRSISAAEPARYGSGEIKLPPPALSRRPFSEVVRQRRSALDFLGGTQLMSLPQLSAILASAMRPLLADFAGAGFIQLYIYAHRVDGLEPGVYRLWAEGSELEQIVRGDQRVAAAGLSLGQDLAGNACVALSMIGDLDRATRVHGERGYRYVHFEAGAIGQRLYVAAQALGLGATGIGAFYDEDVHRYLKLPPEKGQVVYHFAIGYPTLDPRLEA
jgi:SagB-type dehydrogenase family enzyme